MARMLVAALEGADMQVDIAARLRSRVSDGNILKQARLAELGTKLAARLLRQYQTGFRPKPDIWFTYHLYYKAPDWIGPIVANALGIPYVVAEASFAPKRADGPWQQSHQAVELALRHADAVFSLNRADMECLRPICDARKLHYLAPFTQIENWQVAERADIDPACVKLVTTAMMRDGDKMKSFEVLASVLGRLKRENVENWHLTVIGDGPERTSVEGLFTAQGITTQNLCFAGLCSPDQTRKHLASADLFVWPAINEAYGMALLEAQASGLPVLAGNTGGVPGVVSDQKTGWLVPVGDEDAFGAQLTRCLTDQIDTLRSFGRNAAAKAKQDHTIGAASDVLGSEIRNIVANATVGGA
ncbi:glycosyltransferase family 4 protein [Thalassospira lohafexi]|uniref:Glycosyl transferase n=1 Tax=Thalassospira lohafexi TaxID=744227 RepID=A0A2N3L8W1_9PROT|nr:glycosyltransferase [Thalassospira lohafexi]PKR59261.1 glycosyl transferase [Thalassospira lohafexi]